MSLERKSLLGRHGQREVSGAQKRLRSPLKRKLVEVREKAEDIHYDRDRRLALIFGENGYVPLSQRGVGKSHQKPQKEVIE